MPLKGRMATLENEVTSLKQRVSVLQADVMGASGGGPPPVAAETPPAVEEAFEPAALLAVDGFVSGHEKKKKHHTVKRGDDLKTKVATAEADVADLQSQL